jgi:mRNA interferase HigB
MELLGRHVLDRAIRRHTNCRRWIVDWMRAVEEAEWESIVDVRADYPTADGVKLGSGCVVTVFDVRGHTYRPLTEIDYDRQIVTALDLLTHAEYDKESWKWRY